MLKNTSPTVIIGGGVAGLSAAIELSKRGVKSLILEKKPQLGGHVASFCCKAVHMCVHCGACRLGDLLSEVAKRPEIEILLCADLKNAARNKGIWTLNLEPSDEFCEPGKKLGRVCEKPMEIKAKAVILACGHEPFDARQKTRFGYGRINGVVTAYELEAMLMHGHLMAPNGAPPEKVAFIQCVGSRDESLGNLYCSRVCCGFALDMAEVIKGQLPDCEVTFFHMDVQNYGPGWQFALEFRKMAMNFVRGIPGEIKNHNGKPQVVFSLAGCQPTSEDFDMVVLSVGLTPPKDADKLSEMFGISQTKDGFLGEDDGMNRTSGYGVFVAGAACEPKGIIESIDHAALAAKHCVNHIKEADNA